MPRLIDADALCKVCQASGSECTGNSCEVPTMPTIDPVHAAGACYCGECVEYNKPRLGWCAFHMDRENPNDFCTYGKRKEN